MEKGISVIMVLYNDGEIVRNTLESIKDVVDEILIVHDGPCKNKTLDICKEYTKKIYVRPHKGYCEYHQAFLYRKSKFNWILKLDGDEFLSKDIQKNIRRLIKNKNADAYSFFWPYWNGSKYITKEFPRKANLYRKNKISYIGFANWGEPGILGNTVKTKYILEHRPPRGDPTKWKTFFSRDIGSVLLSQAKDATKPFSSFDKFQYKENNFPKKLLVRIRYPIISAAPIGIISSLRCLFSRDIIKNPTIIIKTSFYVFLRSMYYGYYIYKLKKIN